MISPVQQARTNHPARPDTFSDMTSFSSQRQKFLSGETTPREFLESCIAQIERREADIKAFAHLDLPAARQAADAATQRYRDNRPLSAIDGMPVGIKDVFDTIDMPTEMGTPVHAGRWPDADAAHVYALRAGGGIVVGKTVTSQFAIVGNGPTRNPLDLSRSPGATSAGSAAAVAAQMLPLATGSQARGSLLRPASYCGIIGYKPTFGALNRAGCLTPAKSYDHLGALVRSLDDLWNFLWHVGQKAGGDPGHPGLFGEPSPPSARKLSRVAVVQTAGWVDAADTAKAAFEGFIGKLRDSGVTVHDRDTAAEVSGLEDLLAQVPAQWERISSFENRFPLQSYRDTDPSKLHPGILRGLAAGEAMTLADYRDALAFRENLRRAHDAALATSEILITLSGPGAAPLFPDSGSSSFNEPATLLGAPAISLPLLNDGDLPLGVQLIGRAHGDYELLGYAAGLK
jgi:Asp-tRNA(Asn)/Glu-tRNA(Gln) amidotransferase A subunit family amidase